ncbi:CIC11C00000002225 [Sungouiella intermedia]|uniref:CIC11C00000000354 n=1 Tax=Sungouiella intermedia TaxID=45354 RepID=A0A1L0BX38_9ASCO|nr:CIC11C00000000354 [[Candida] intermedia]SGZ55913.1 CIC11C00000002225 [[Candida] intermedia]
MEEKPLVPDQKLVQKPDQKPDQKSDQKQNRTIPTILQVSRPFFTFAELSYLHGNTIPENRKLAYNQRKHQVFQFLFQIVRIMKFPLRTLSTAMSYYQRYYLFNMFEEPKDQNPDNDPIVEFEKDPYMVAYTCIFLATKHEDCIKKLKDIQTVANKLRDIDQDSRTFAKTSSAITLFEVQRKVIMSLEFKLLQVLKFDFLNGASTIPSIESLVVIFSKQLGLDYNYTLFGWLVSFDILSTPLPLVVPPHCIALAIVIITLNLKPTDIRSKYGEKSDNSDFSDILDNLDCLADFKCPEALVNEAIVYILDYYVHQMNFLILNEYMPATNLESGKEQIFKFMDLKSRFNDLKVLSEASVSTQGLLKQDNYLRKWDYTVGSKGAARFMISNKRRRFDAEYVILRPPK